MTNRTYLVQARHTSPRFTFVDKIVSAKPAPGHDGFWFATSDGLGCSKDYSTPEAAVRSLFIDNACFDIVIGERKSESEYAELIAVFNSNVSNSSLNITDKRRAIILQALIIAQESDAAMRALRPKMLTEHPPCQHIAPAFDIKKLSFTEAFTLGKLRSGPIEIAGEHVSPTHLVLADFDLIEITDLKDAGLHPSGRVRIQITAMGTRVGR